MAKTIVTTISPQSKYWLLFKFLEQQPSDNLLELTFTEIETVLGKKLPASALSSRAWWANSQTVQGQAWQNAGWLVDYPDLENQLIVFRPQRITYRVTPIRKSVGWSAEQIKALREFAGLSQQEFADRLAVRQQTISDWELGYHVARRSMNKLLELMAKEVGFPYTVD